MPEWPSLDVAIRHRIGVLTLNVEFQLSKPWTVLFAPSGAGKTTVLRTIAGLIRPQQACIVWTEAPGSPDHSIRRSPPVLADTAKKSFAPAHTRGFPMATQNSALFPHRTVAKNVSYGFSEGSSRSEADHLLQELLALCRIEHLADKLPAQLSGGERQRVALARALGADGSAVLLDEPFAGIDATLKEDLMREVKTWLGAKQTPVLHVTHDVGEVFAVADEVIRLSEGRVVAQGPPEAVLQEERQRLLAWLGP